MTAAGGWNAGITQHDTKIMKSFIKEQNALGAELPENLDSWR